MSRPQPTREESTAAFPPLEDAVAPTQDVSLFRTRSRESTQGTGRARRLSTLFKESNPPLGFIQATGEVVSQAPTFSDIRRGTYTSREIQSQWRRSSISSSERSRASSGATAPPNRGTLSRAVTTADPVPEHADEHILATIPSDQPPKAPKEEVEGVETAAPSSDITNKETGKTDAHIATQRLSSETPPSDSKEVNYPTGYHFPPKHTKWQSTVIGAKAFWKFATTPFGFLLVIYGANIVAWGGMLFLLLIGGGKAMCHPTCNDINSPRRKWIEVDSQILNALFCVTGFGLIPWRFRDLYYLMQYRLRKNYDGLRRLAGINRSWFRLEGSQDLPVPALAKEGDIPVDSPPRALALPEASNPDPPLTGYRAPPTKVWKLDVVIWLYVANTALQAVLCGFMWGLNRYDRPSWSTGTFVALACIVAAAAGILSAVEGGKVKKVEGVPWGEADMLIDAEKGVGTAKDPTILGYKDEKAAKAAEK